MLCVYYIEKEIAKITYIYEIGLLEILLLYYHIKVINPTKITWQKLKITTIYLYFHILNKNHFYWILICYSGRGRNSVGHQLKTTLDRLRADIDSTDWCAIVQVSDVTRTTFYNFWPISLTWTMSLNKNFVFLLMSANL